MILISDNHQKLQDYILNDVKGIEYDELCVLSGYLGLGPIETASKIKEIKITILFGLAEEILSEKLKQCLVEYHSNSENNISIHGPSIKSHSKIYIWKNKGKVVHALSGSANFSSNGLLSNYREVLVEVQENDLTSIHKYYLEILESSKPITEIKVINKIPIFNKNVSNEQSTLSDEIASPSLFAKKSNINWGHGNAKNNIRDSSIPINTFLIENYSSIFTPKANDNGLGFADNEPFDIVWDDNEKMIGLFEGTQTKNKLRYPNKIATYKDKKILGDYLRKRMNIAPGEFVSKDDFKQYGRDNITIKQIGESQFYFDFSV